MDSQVLNVRWLLLIRNNSSEFDQLSRTAKYTTLKEGSKDRKSRSFFAINERLCRFAGRFRSRFQRDFTQFLKCRIRYFLHAQPIRSIETQPQ